MPIRPPRALRAVRWTLRRLAAQARRTTYGPVNAAQGAWDDAVDWFNGLELGENSILLGFAAVIGLAGAVGIIVFYKLIDLAHEGFFTWPESVLPALGRLAYRPILTGAGAVTAWWTMQRFARGVTMGRTSRTSSSRWSGVRETSPRGLRWPERVRRS
jgi:hypothetical protein